MQPHAILASQSPRRRFLLEGIGWTLDIRPADIDEAPLSGEAPVSHVRRLAEEKARAIPAAQVPVVAADTIVVHRGAILGKPRDAAHATEMLRGLSGASHTVMTGYAVRLGDGLRSGVVSTTVTFRPLSDAAIAAYVATGEPLDKAGAYGIQGHGGALVDRVHGSYSSVVGLPVQEVRAALDALVLATAPGGPG